MATKNLQLECVGEKGGEWESKISGKETSVCGGEVKRDEWEIKQARLRTPRDAALRAFTPPGDTRATPRAAPAQPPRDRNDEKTEAAKSEYASQRIGSESLAPSIA